jgi:hypothetical protein
LSQRRYCQCERWHKQHGQPPTFYLKFHSGLPSFSPRPLAGDSDDTPPQPPLRK